MADQYTETSYTGFFGNLGNSFKGILVGFVLFLLSFVVLWVNEGRANFAKIAKSSVIVSPDKVNHEAEGKLVAVTGNLVSDEKIGDIDFLNPQDFIALERFVEIYSWREFVNEREEKNIGGGTTKTKIYTYEKAWTIAPENSSNFKIKEGHENSKLDIQQKIFFVKLAKIGVYEISPKDIDLPVLSYEKVLLDQKNVILKDGFTFKQNYLFKGKGSLQEPQVGDVRVSFLGLEKGRGVTAFGKQENSSLVPFYYKTDKKFFRVLDGSFDQALAKLSKEHKLIGWLLRLIGFLLMWAGLSLLFGPIISFLNVLPILGTIGEVLIWGAMFIVALVLSAITIIVSMIAHNILALLIVLFLGLASIGWFIWKRRKRKIIS